MAGFIFAPSGASPSGSDTQVQFNDGGTFNGATGLTYNKTTQTTTFTPSNNQIGLSNTANSLTGSNAQSLVDLTQTWNTTGIPSLLNFTVTDTASNASSRFATFITGTFRRAEIRKDGSYFTYNTFTDSSNFESGFMQFVSNQLRIGTGRSGTGTTRELHFYTGGTLRGKFDDGSYGFQTDAIGLQVGGGGGMPTIKGDASGGITIDSAITGSASLRFVRRLADPSAPAANRADLYIKDNGSGKIQLAIRFPTGAVQIIATEP